MTTTQQSSDTPFALFDQWYKEAMKLELEEPNYMTLATATADGKPSARVVLLKGYDENGFRFYTNLISRKSRELLDNPYAAMCFYWQELGKQIRIEGKVEPTTEKQADDYFASRQRGSQLGAWASKQSAVMEHEGDLIVRVKTVTDEYQGKTIPRPPFWSGFKLVPDMIEFWQRGEFRLHTRLVYRKAGEGWDTENIYP